eukprot:1328353-Rhodomonas_salina.2
MMRSHHCIGWTATDSTLAWNENILHESLGLRTRNSHHHDHVPNLRISTSGPQSLVKASRLSTSTDTSPTARTVACLGLPDSSAISPKNSPADRRSTNT